MGHLGDFYQFRDLIATQSLLYRLTYGIVYVLSEPTTRHMKCETIEIWQDVQHHQKGIIHPAQRLIALPVVVGTEDEVLTRAIHRPILPIAITIRVADLLQEDQGP